MRELNCAELSSAVVSGGCLGELISMVSGEILASALVPKIFGANASLPVKIAASIIGIEMGSIVSNLAGTLSKLDDAFYSKISG